MCARTHTGAEKRHSQLYWHTDAQVTGTPFVINDVKVTVRLQRTESGNEI